MISKDTRVLVNVYWEGIVGTLALERPLWVDGVLECESLMDMLDFSVILQKLRGDASRKSWDGRACQMVLTTLWLKGRDGGLEGGE